MKAKLLVALISVAACSSPATRPGPSLSSAPSKTSRYSVLTADRVVGEQTVEHAADGSVTVRYRFNDRGRGPELVTKIWPGEDGLPRRMEIRGVDYYKVAVEEDFVREREIARWRNSAEEGHKTWTGPAFYLALNGNPEDGARLARALFANGGRLPLLPSGEATIERLGALDVRRGDEQRTVSLVAIDGIYFNPTLIWLDSGGELFADLGNWGGTIREGWETSAELLRGRQRELARARLQKIASSLSHRPERSLVFRGVDVFDAAAARTIRDQTVVITGELIAAVGPSANVAIPDGAQIIDGRGHTLLPGLWDMHVHVNEAVGLQHLAAGVTSVRDLGNQIDLILDIKRAWDDGTVLGPRLIYSGFIDGPGPYAGPIGALVSTEEEMHAAVSSYAAKGVEQIKLYSSLDPKLVPIAVAEAKRHGLRVSGHVPNGMTAAELVAAGADELQHMNFLALNFLDVPDTRTPERFHAVGREAAGLDLKSPQVRDFITLLAEKKIVVDTTVNIFEDMFTLRAGEVDPAVATVADRLPIGVARQAKRGGLAPKGMEERYRASFDALIRFVGELHTRGITLVAGTDAMPGFSLHRELELYVRAGIPAGAALRIATLGAAEVTKRSDRLGTIAPGKLADLVLVAGDPARRIEDIRKTVLVVKGGVYYRSDELYGAIGVRPSPPTKIVRSARLIDGRGRTLENVLIWIDGDRIRDVTTDQPPPPGVELIDLGALTVIPGMIDVHTHMTYASDPEWHRGLVRPPGFVLVLAQANLTKTLEAGVTSVRDLHASDYGNVALRKLIELGRMVGPRMFVAGHGLRDPRNKKRPARDPPEPGLVKGVGAIKRAVAELAAADVDWVKMFGSTGGGDDVSGDQTFNYEEMKAAVETAHRLGKKITIHSYGPSGARDAVRAGADSIEHAIDLDEQTLAEMVERGTFYVPTIDHNRYYLEHGKEWGFAAGYEERLTGFIERNVETTRRASRAGVRIVMGSDALYGMFGENTRELGWFIKAGMTPEQALATATTNAALLLGKENELGAIAPGYYADLVAVAGDPSKDINAVISGVRWVMKGGEVVVDKSRSGKACECAQDSSR